MILNSMELFEKLINYNTLLNNDANKELLEKYTEIIQAEYIHFIPAVRFDSALFLRLFAMLTKPRNILEIGFGSGVSSYFIAEQLYEVDNFVSLERDTARYERGKKIISQFNMNTVNLIHCDALEYLSNDDTMYDFIFIDAGKNDYTKYLHLIKDKLVTSGILICDNTFFNANVVKEESDIQKNHIKPTHSMKEFNTYLANLKCFNTSFFVVGDGMSLSIKI
ncbi:MAG: hypothetical protein A2015_09355 [Spirochaetes bacterium GWF1_31_7]|nr:MAG: hypothetical protein A2Y30_08865 [Spirochaetes bacterium GWE1_32_154]OHD45697.1 MAG: hypothetical protein A2Y29_10270 [Spirochaetes bacterium GWE2_31_10]OHD47691.1 MAG: hypothetical protein A2015_09355 [Spirochaetes bacterium GWF1_31_7]HBD94796.1 hypothetical protein [Spirochaetia bacterium]